MMNNDTHFSLVMIELEKISTKMDKLEKELAEFKQTMNYPSQIITNFETQYAIGEQSNWVPHLATSSLGETKIGY